MAHKTIEFSPELLQLFGHRSCLVLAWISFCSALLSSAFKVQKQLKIEYQWIRNQSKVASQQEENFHQLLRIGWHSCWNSASRISKLIRYWFCFRTLWPLISVLKSRYLYSTGKQETGGVRQCFSNCDPRTGGLIYVSLLMKCLLQLQTLPL
jgi:hypothetical protein